MRRKHLILASCIISALLLTFTFHVSADENVTADAGASSNSAPLLDSYFWDNYTLLPYIESDGTQYIDTGIKAHNHLKVSLQFNNFRNAGGVRSLYGVGTENRLYGGFATENNFPSLGFGSQTSFVSTVSYYFTYMNYLIFDENDCYLNNQLLNSFNDETFESNYSIYLFTTHNDSTGEVNTGALSSYRLYNFYIYDYSLNDPLDPDSGEVGYVRYYYPARSKSGDVIGLYDAVSKTFVTTSGNTPFANPVGSDAEMGITANIVQFITNGLSWIGDILEFAIEEPMILMFMAIGLCGVAFRWARRVVHF